MALVAADGETKRDYQESRDFLIQSHVRDIRFKKEEVRKVEDQLSRMMKQLGFQLETRHRPSNSIGSSC